MKVYTPLEETSTYRDLYNSYNGTVDNLNSSDFLYKSYLSDGRVFSNEVGYVNLQEATMRTNIIIAAADLGNFKIRGFVYYSRKYNVYKTMDINCDLTQYKDGKPHFLYVLLQTGGTFEVHDSMVESTDEKMLFARFIIGTDGNSIQFYLLAPFAGTPDYIKTDSFYEVADGFLLSGNTDGNLFLQDGKIKFSGINFDDKSDPDTLNVAFNGNALNFRYNTWDSTNSVPTVDWTQPLINTINPSNYMDYTTGTVESLGSTKYSIQKLYYDPCTGTGVIELGDRAYNSLDAAVKSMSTVVSYPLIDGIKYLIPIAAIANKSGNRDLTDTTKCAIAKLIPSESIAFGLDQMSQQMALEAQLIAQQALDTATLTQQGLSNHTLNVSNPHSVTAAQLNIDSSLTNITATQIYQNAGNYINNSGALDGRYLKLTGGSITGALSVSGAVTLNNTLDVAGQVRLGPTLATSLVCAGVSNMSGIMYFKNNGTETVRIQPSDGYIKTTGKVNTQHLTVNDNYVIIGTDRLYLGSLPNDAPTGSYAIYVS